MRYTPIGYTKYLKGLKKTQLMFRQGEILESLAEKSWNISPGNTTLVPKAYFLEGQLDRITGTFFTPDPYALMQGGHTITHRPTRAFMLKNIWMLNGYIHKGLHQFVLHHRSKIKTSMHIFPPITVDTEINDAAIYSTYDGNEYFGEWLVHDCATYLLAASEGTPVTSDIFTSPHMLEYKSMLDMKPIETNAVFMKNAILFDDDWDYNKGKHERFCRNRNKLLSKFSGNKHPGVFILRGNSGKSRVMLNEIEIAQQLREIYGFRIIDVSKQSAVEIVSACVGAQIIAGIEGSHIAHGLMVLQPGTSLLILQPPNRFAGGLKMTTDIEHIHYGFVVGIPKEEGFYINFEEVEKTIALLPTKL